jgi:hypothetical protein
LSQKSVYDAIPETRKKAKHKIKVKGKNLFLEEYRWFFEINIGVDSG